jgi:DNA-directed RNA polymerase specialized sigma24 family protein
MTALKKNRTSRSQSSQYATNEDFCRVFADNLKQLYVFSFLLTGDQDLAERCFVAGLEESVRSNCVFSEWARSWAMRTIVQNAVRALQPYPCHGSPSFSDTRSDTSRRDGRESIPAGDFELYRVLELEDFERFVFVMSVLERYSDHDCGLLLGCSLQKVREARIRALDRMGELGHADHSRDVPTARASRQVLAALNALGD